MQISKRMFHGKHNSSTQRGKRKDVCAHKDCNNIKERKDQGYCNACHAAWMRSKRPKHSQLSAAARVKANARAYANTYLRRGKIIKQGCSVCGQQAQMHHVDYNKPLVVAWYCRQHRPRTVLA